LIEKGKNILEPLYDSLWGHEKKYLMAIRFYFILLTWVMKKIRWPSNYNGKEIETFFVSQ
jgi:hypothetical protein